MHRPARVSMPHSPVVLVVEDDSVVRNICEAILQRAGYTVLATGESVQALEMAQVSRANIVAAFVDIALSHVSGLELIQRWRDQGLVFPVICMSGYPLNHIPERYLTHPISCYFLPKPFTPLQLLSILRTALSER